MTSIGAPAQLHCSPCPPIYIYCPFPLTLLPLCTRKRLAATSREFVLNGPCWWTTRKSNQKLTKGIIAARKIFKKLYSFVSNSGKKKRGSFKRIFFRHTFLSPWCWMKFCFFNINAFEFIHVPTARDFSFLFSFFSFFLFSLFAFHELTRFELFLF